MKALQEEKNMLLTSDKSLAEYNLSQEPVVREAKARLQEKYRAAQQLGEESEQMTDTFLSGGDNLEEFLEQYHEKRKLAHLRRVKVDKLKELIRNQQQQGTPSRVAP